MESVSLDWKMHRVADAQESIHSVTDVKGFSNNCQNRSKEIDHDRSIGGSKIRGLTLTYDLCGRRMCEAQTLTSELGDRRLLQTRHSHSQWHSIFEKT